MALASPGWPDPGNMALFAIGALVMRGAGCTINDLADHKIDSLVARTATRPIADGQVGILMAFVFLGLQLLAGLLVLMQFNALTVQVGIASLVLVAVYPFMKRITYWPQLFLGLTFNWGALIGWSAVTGTLAPVAGLAYAAGITWTLGYDTIYAHQDKADDILVGVKSTALKFGAASRAWLVAFYGAAVALLAAAGYAAGLAWPFFVALALGGVHLGWQIKAIDIDNPDDCLAKFKSNRDFGLIVFVGIVAAQVLA